MKNNIGIFVSDEGFGHFVRQKIIISELLKKKFKITVYNEKNLYLFKEYFKNKINYCIFSNNLKSIKNFDGTLNRIKTIKKFNTWSKNCLLQKKSILKKISNHHFIISDFIPEIFFLSNKVGIPAIGICHFTLSWFYFKLTNKKNAIFNKLKYFENCSNKIT